MSEVLSEQTASAPASEPASEWSDADVTAALTAAAASERAAESGEQAPATSSTDAPAGATETASQTVQPVQAEQNTETFDSGKFNPDELPAELQDRWKQLQAAFTQKTQELAAQRQQFEALGDPQSLQQAVELYNRIADPNSWPQLYGELTDAMQQAGMSLPQAQAAAAEAVAAAQTAPAVQTPQLPAFDDLDPEIQPLVKMLQETRAELDAFKTANETERMNREAERQHILLLNELTRQEQVVRETHPTWDDEKIEAVYEMSSFYGGNLTQAAARLEQLLGRERELYLSQKSSAMTESTRTPAPNSPTTQTERVTEPQTLKDAEAEAIDFFAARVADLTQ